MPKLWLVAMWEYRRRALQKGFVLALLSVPLVLALIIGLIAITVAMEDNDAPVGYVDHAGLLADPIPALPRAGSFNNPSWADLVPLVPLETEEAARRALEAGEIQAYYAVAADYLDTKRVNLVYLKPPGENATRQFWDFMQINLLSGLPPQVASRAVAGSSLIVRWPDDAPGGGREFSQRTFLSNFLPLFIAVGVLFLLFMSSGYLMSAVVEEKENRTIEVLVTSLSPNQLIGGKIVAIIAVALTQLLFWILFAALAVIVGDRYLGIAALQNLTVNMQIVATMMAIAAPTFVLVAALMTAVGATVAEVQEAQQVTAIFILPTMVPLWLLQPILENPNSPLSIALSLLPVTSLPTLCFRVTFAQVPPWQIATSAALASLCALGALWLAGRAFRLGMLRYGQRLDLGELLGLKREARGMGREGEP